MSHTNETPNFHLPQFIATDKPDWLVDVNDAFQAIDTGMASTQSEAESATSTAQLAQTTAEGAAETAGQASSDVAGLTTDLETLQGTVNAVTALIGNGTPTTTDKTIIGAINELALVVEAGSVSVTADGVKTVSQLLDALHALIDASKVKYNSCLQIGDNVATLVDMSSGNYQFITSFTSSGGFTSKAYTSKASGSEWIQVAVAAGGNTVTDRSSVVLTNGDEITLYY